MGPHLEDADAGEQDDDGEGGNGGGQRHVPEGVVDLRPHAPVPPNALSAGKLGRPSIAGQTPSTMLPRLDIGPAAPYAIALGTLLCAPQPRAP